MEKFYIIGGVYGILLIIFILIYIIKGRLWQKNLEKD